MNIGGIIVDNIERFKDTKTLINLNINLILANHKKYRVKRNNDMLTFIDIETLERVYSVDIEDLSSEEAEALDVAFNNKVQERKYKIGFTCKPGEYVYVLLPIMIEGMQRFTFDLENIHYLKVERLYGDSYTYVVTDLVDETSKRFLGVPNIFCFKNINDVVTACKITPEDGYKCIAEFEENCEKYIKYNYIADTGYAYKSVIPYEFLVDYDISGNTFTYGIWFDTNEDTAFTYTLPIAFNEVTGKIIKEITRCRADSLGKNGINISINNEQILIKRVKVKVAFDIDKLEDKDE